MEKFNFTVGEELTFVWRFEKEKLTPKHCKVEEIEETGIWVTFDDEPDRENFITFVDMHFFVRDGRNVPEGTKALLIDEITKKYLGI